MRYSREIAGPGGLYGFVEAAAGQRVARVQGALWVFSYALYLIYTTAYVVYDVLPAVSPRFNSYRSTLEVLLPIGIAAAVLAGRRTTMVVLAVIAVGQLVLVGFARRRRAGSFTDCFGFAAAGAPACDRAGGRQCGAVVRLRQPAVVPRW